MSRRLRQSQSRGAETMTGVRVNGGNANGESMSGASTNGANGTTMTAGTIESVPMLNSDTLNYHADASHEH